MLTKLNILILGWFLLFVTPIMCSAEDNDNPDMSGPHKAKVIVPRAIVYSDESLNSPLGYISSDKLITVGNPRKKNPDLLPMIVYGRVAFIEAKNIQYESESLEASQNSKRGAPREHNIDLVLNKPEEKLSENNSVYLAIHEFGAGVETKDLFSAINKEEKGTFTGFDLSILHRQTTGKFLWGAGIDYNILTSSGVDFNLFMLSPIVGFTPIRNPLFMTDLLFSFDIVSSAQLKIKTNTVNEPNGFAYGPQFGARIVFFPNLNYHITGNINYRSYKVVRLETVEDANGNSINGVSKISGVNLGIGLAFEI